MKTLLQLLSVIMLITTVGCASSYQAGSPEYDDIYYSSNDAIIEESMEQERTQKTTPADRYTTPEGAREEEYEEEYYDEGYAEDDYYDEDYSESYRDGGGNVTNNYYNGDNYQFNYDDYHDYAYSARIRRFHQPAVSYSYYDPFYTNYYWYNYDPYYYGSSIYLGYHWWRPTIWSVGVAWATGWNMYGGWNYYNDPFYSYRPYGWSGYHYGYNQGYNNGYWNGYNDGLCASTGYYYNSLDANSYYGHRNSRTSTGKTDRSSFAQTYKNAAKSGRAVPATAMSDKNSTPASIRNRKLNEVGKYDMKGGDKAVKTNNGTRPAETEVKNNHGTVKDNGTRPAKGVDAYTAPKPDKGLKQKGGNIEYKESKTTGDPSQQPGYGRPSKDAKPSGNEKPAYRPAPASRQPNGNEQQQRKPAGYAAPQDGGGENANPKDNYRKPNPPAPEQKQPRYTAPQGNDNNNYQRKSNTQQKNVSPRSYNNSKGTKSYGKYKSGNDKYNNSRGTKNYGKYNSRNDKYNNSNRSKNHTPSYRSAPKSSGNNHSGYQRSNSMPQMKSSGSSPSRGSGGSSPSPRSGSGRPR